jgi:hypothetical protein
VSSALEVSGLCAELAQLSAQQQRLSEEYAAVAAERDSLLQQVRCRGQLVTVALCCSLIGAGKVSVYTRCSMFQCMRALWGVGVACKCMHVICVMACPAPADSKPNCHFSASQLSLTSGCCVLSGVCTDCRKGAAAAAAD